MPIGMINNITQLMSKEAITKPYYTLIAIIILMFIMIFTQRIFNMNKYNYSIITTCVMILIVSLFIISTILNTLHINDTNYHIERYNNIFNSSGSRNFLVVISLIFSIIFIYETPQYGNNLPHKIVDDVTFGNNKYISNRMVGIWLIVFFGLVTGYTVFVTTRDDK